MTQPRLQSPERSLLGAEQEAWLFERLEASQRDGIAWRFLGQQVPFASWAAKGAAGHPDKWDGYVASRTRLLDEIATEGIADVVILTGDVHSSWAFDVPRDPYAAAYDPATASGSLAIELITPAISSSSLGSFEGVRERYAETWSKLPTLASASSTTAATSWSTSTASGTRGMVVRREGGAAHRRRAGSPRALVSRRGSHHLEPA